MKTNLKNIFIAVLVSASSIMISSCAPAGSTTQNPVTAATHNEPPEQINMMDELNPFDPNIESQLQQMDREYYEQTGQNPFEALLTPTVWASCKRMACKVFALIKKSEQKMYLYIDQKLDSTWLVSTGLAGAYETPLLDLHPNGRIYDKYTSTKYPGGDYKGLGNMPYAVFLYNGFAVHGTGEGNWKNLGKKASHGCIRLHPDNGYKFNRLVREHGINAVWVQITN